MACNQLEVGTLPGALPKVLPCRNIIEDGLYWVNKQEHASDAGCSPLESGAMLLTEGQPLLHMLVSSEYIDSGLSPACCSMHCPKCTPAGIALLMPLHVAAFIIGKRPYPLNLLRKYQLFRGF